jgi:hypothetical protein
MSPIRLKACTVVLILFLGSASAAEIKVDSLSDAGVGSLRQAIASASDGDTVLLRATGELTLTTPIVVDKSLTIQGQKGALSHTISGAGSVRLFVIAPNRTVTLSGLTLAAGYAPSDGGAVFSEGALSLDGVRMTRSRSTGSGGAVFQRTGSLTINNSYFSGQHAGTGGGAIATENARLIINSSGFAENAASSSGGAILANGSSTEIRNSALFSNQAGDFGGAIAIAGSSGRFVNLTLVENAAPEAAHVSSAYGASVAIGNSIVAGLLGFQSISGNGALVSLGHNLSDGPAEEWNAVTDLAEIPTGLGARANLGGLSPSFPLEPGSPAIDAGSNALAGGSDQRGLSRFSNGNGDGRGNTVDIGAFEVQLYRVSSLQILGAATGGEDDGGFGIFRNDPELIASADAFAQLTAAGRADLGDAFGANNAAGGGAVVFVDSIVPGRILLKGRELVVRRNLAIYGPGADRLAIDGAGLSRVMRVGEGAHLYISGLALENGTGETGGGMLIDGNASVELESVSVRGNAATASGGGLALQSGRTTIVRSSLTGNSAAERGGALYAAPETNVVIDTSTVSENVAGTWGGGLAIAGDVWIQSSTFAGNTAGVSAPGLRLESGAAGQIQNTILAHGGMAAVEVASEATLLSGGNNLSDAAESVFSHASDLLETDPKIGPLALNGGATLSHAPLYRSPAINAGDSTDAPPLDQPGFQRIRGGFIDIGSVEIQNDPPTVVCADPVAVECVSEGTASVTINVRVEDAEADALTVVWRLDGEIFATDIVAAGTSSALLSQTLQLPLDESMVTVTAEDAYSISTPCVVPVVVVDSAAPVITLLGETTVYLECGDSYTDAGATAFDACEGVVTTSIFFSDLPIGPVSPGTYAITYRARDASGNTSMVTRAVVVRDTLSPEVELIGSPSITLEAGIETWSDPGAMALDRCSGALPVSVTIIDAAGFEVPTIATHRPGTFTVFYSAADEAGNLGQVTRQVEVVDTTPPSIKPLEDLTLVTDPGSCDAEAFFAAEVTDNSVVDPNVVYSILPNPAYPAGLEITSPFRFAPGIHEVTATATDASGNFATAVFRVTVTDESLNCIRNVSWPNALPLSLEAVPAGSGRSVEVRQFLAEAGQARWYRFAVQPGSRVTVVLSELPANYDLVLYRDIHEEYLRLLGLIDSDDRREQDLALLGAEFAPESFSPESFSPESFSPESFSPESFSPESFSPESFSPESFSPESFSPESFSPESFSPESFSPESFSPESFSPESFSPESFSPESFSPESFSPESFSSAQVRSMIGFSAFPGLVSEGLSLNTFTRSGEFYVRVRGANGAYSLDAPFKITVIVESEICEGVFGPESFGPASLTANGPDYQTIVLWDSTRTTGSNAEVNDLAGKLGLFASRPEVAGVVVDVSTEARVEAANRQADDFPSCPYAKNLVATEIKRLIDAYRLLNPRMRYVVLLGSDDAIPFFRITDQAMLANESNYVPPVIDSTHSQSSLRYGQILSQDPYGSFCELTLVTGPYAFPELAVGRLVETAVEVGAQIDRYLATEDGVLPVPTNALVTGYDFLDDGARAVQGEFEAAIGGSVSTLIADASVPPSEGWSATDLANILFGSRHDLIFLAGHFSTGATLAADYRTRLTAAEMLASGASFADALVFSAGCHSGYNTVDHHAVNGITRQPDWAQAFGRLGAVYIAGTGYQYGDTEFVEYGERLYLEFARELRTGSGPVTIGDALNRAKRRYLEETPLMRGIHEKTLVQVTLYGLPMLKFDAPGERLTATVKGMPLATDPALVSGGPGRLLGLQRAELSFTPDLERQDLELLNISDNSTVTASWFVGRHGIVTNPAEPVRPLETFLASVPGTLLRGVGFRGGSYEDLEDFLPLTGAPTTEIRGVFGNFFSEAHFPIQPYSVNNIGALCGGLSGQRFNVYPNQFLAYGGGALGGTMRKYTAMDFRLYYNGNRGTSVSDSGFLSIPALAPAPSIVVVESAVDEESSSVDFNITISGSSSAGIQEAWITYTGAPGSPLHGEWRSIDLLQNPANSELWSASLSLGEANPSELRFMVQAVSGVGLVAINTNLGRYHRVGGFEAAERQPTVIELIDPPSEGAYFETVALQARLTSKGLPVAGSPVGFRIGGSRVTGLTDEDGIAQATLRLSVRPSSLTLQADFAGDSDYAPSVVAKSFTITRQATQITFDPLPGMASGESVVVTLLDAQGAPMRERTVFFVVDYGGLQVGNAAITDFAGRADLSELSLPAGEAVVTAYFNGTIPVPGAEPITFSDDLFLPSIAAAEVSFADPAKAFNLRFNPRLANVLYRASPSRSRTPPPPLYQSASIHGDLALPVGTLPFQLQSSPGSGEVSATIEARLAGLLIASGSVMLDTRGDGGSHWTSGRLHSNEIAYVGIHWNNAPSFDSARSQSPGPRIYTTFIGEHFSELRYLPASGTYRTTLPGGAVISVINGTVDLATCSGFTAGDLTSDEQGLTVALNQSIVPGMVFSTRTHPSGSLVASVPVIAGQNYQELGGSAIVRLAAQESTPRPTSNGTPNQLELRLTFGSGEKQVRSSTSFGEGGTSFPWSLEHPVHKQYRR